MMIELTIVNKDHEVKQGKNDYEDGLRPCTVRDETFCILATQDLAYEEGDTVQIKVTENNQYLMVKLDETLNESLVFIPNKEWTYHIICDELQREALPDCRFASKRHVLSARQAEMEEIENYQNLSFNPHDQKEFTGAFPHASANVETRNDATFFACNAIDGVFANKSHGSYPYQSWGINQQDDAALTIDFGREVQLDKAKITLRADFPHDNYWQEVSLQFDGEVIETFKTQKTGLPQTFRFAERKTRQVTFFNLKKSTEESPFPALTQLELFGKNSLGEVK